MPRSSEGPESLYELAPRVFAFLDLSLDTPLAAVWCFALGALIIKIMMDLTVFLHVPFVFCGDHAATFAAWISPVKGNVCVSLRGLPGFRSGRGPTWETLPADEE